MSQPYYQDEHVTLWHGDALAVLAGTPDGSVDAVVTDPPPPGAGVSATKRGSDGSRVLAGTISSRGSTNGTLWTLPQIRPGDDIWLTDQWCSMTHWVAASLGTTTRAGLPENPPPATLTIAACDGPVTLPAPGGTQCAQLAVVVAVPLGSGGPR